MQEEPLEQQLFLRVVLDQSVAGRAAGVEGPRRGAGVDHEPGPVGVELLGGGPTRASRYIVSSAVMPSISASVRA